MQIEEKFVERPSRRCIKQGVVQDVETGRFREQTLIKEDGSKVVERVPIMQRIFHEPVFEDTVVRMKVFAVKTTARAPKGKFLTNNKGLLVPSMDEEHEFASREDAERFIKDTAQDEIRKRARGER